MLDLLIITPSAKKLYQDLGENHMAIEPPIWAMLLAQSVRSEFGVAIYDLAADPPKDEQDLINRVNEYNPKTVLFSVNGINPNSGSFFMDHAIEAAKMIKRNIDVQIAFCGPHCAALPNEVLEEDCVDIVFVNEGVYALKNLLKNGGSPYKVKGLWYKKDGEVIINDPEKIVPQEMLPTDLPGFAYDLLPSLDAYRTSSWHCQYDDDAKSPFASIYTSLGCVHKCSFCIINTVNRTSNDLTKTAADFNIFRYWDPEFLITQFDYLAEKGIKNIKIADEMFVLKPRHFLKLSELLIERDYGFNLWSYSRIDSVRAEYLDKLKGAGVNTLALGIESGNQIVRQEASKGKFKELDIRDVVKMIEDAGIEVISNFIIGVSDAETHETAEETRLIAEQINSGAMNVYAATPLPGSPLYQQKIQSGLEKKRKYSEYGFLSYDHVPSATNFMTSAEVLKFRDDMWYSHHTNPSFLSMIKSKFGQVAVDNINKMTKIKLRRKLLGD